jgi:hypothetical protein
MFYIHHKFCSNKKRWILSPGVLGGVIGGTVRVSGQRTTHFAARAFEVATSDLTDLLKCCIAEISFLTLG